MGAIVPWKVSMSDLFLTGMAVFRLILGGIKVAGLSANFGMLSEITGTEVMFTC